MYNLNGLFVGRPSCIRRQLTKRDPSVTEIFADHSYARGVVDEYNYGQIPLSGQATLISYSHHTPHNEDLTNQYLGYYLAQYLVAVAWLRWAVKLSVVGLTEVKLIGHSARGVQAILHCVGWWPNAPECKKQHQQIISGLLFLQDCFLFNRILLSFWVLAHLKTLSKKPLYWGGGRCIFLPPMPNKSERRIPQVDPCVKFACFLPFFV